MLKCETNTQAMSARILAAAFQLFGSGRFFFTDFEYSQWWLTEISTGARWSVGDAEADTDAREQAVGIVDGFLFEPVTEGEDA